MQYRTPHRSRRLHVAATHVSRIGKGVEVVIPGKVFGLARELYGRMPYFAGPGFGIKFGDVVVDWEQIAGCSACWRRSSEPRFLRLRRSTVLSKRSKGSALVNGVQDRIRTGMGRSSERKQASLVTASV